MIKGKNFSCNNSSGKRKKSDFYETPYSLTRLFLEKEADRMPGLVLEPACGNGAIVKVLKEFGKRVVCYDKETDFLKEKQVYNYIITNPPFSIAGDFIEKAKEISERFSFLLPLSYLHGKKRYDEVYCDSSFPLESIYVFTRYPMLGDPLLESGQHRTGMMVYAWFTFSKLVTNKEPVIRWLDNQNFVVGEKEWKDLLTKQQQKRCGKRTL